MSTDNYCELLDPSKTSLEERLYYLVAEACKHPHGSIERQKNLTKLIRLISKNLWKENTPYYQDALQQTWLYFCQNICEGNTGKPYDPARASVNTWLNFYLKQRLHDFSINHQQERIRTVSTPVHWLKSSEAHHTINLIENIPANPDIPPLLEEVITWIETDPERELSRLHITRHPEVTCQVLLLRRLPPETSWKTLSQEFNLPISTLSSFYQQKCLPCLRKFGKLQGYL